MELGLAAAYGISIYALSKDKDEPCRDVLFDLLAMKRSL